MAVPRAKKPAAKKVNKAVSYTATKKNQAKKPPTGRTAPKKTRKVKRTAAKAKVSPKPEKRQRADVADGPPVTVRSPALESLALPPSRPSARVLAGSAELPIERPLSDEEREAMAKVSETARRYVGATGKPPAIVAAIAEFLDDVRAGTREEPTSQDVRLGLGVLWGEQLRAQVGWRWVHLTYPDRFASYALVPDDRAFACFPLNRVPEALRANGANTSARVFESIRDGALPARRANAYLIVG